MTGQHNQGLTIPRLLKYNYEKFGDKRVALRVKDYGIWQTFTWKDYYEKVKYLSLGLISLGLNWGDKVAILGENKPEWYWAEIATQAAGGVVVGIFTDCMPKEVKYYVEHSDSRFVIAHDQEQVDKLLLIKDELPLLVKVIYWDPKGLWNYDDPIMAAYNDVIEKGREFEKKHPGLFEQNIEKLKPDDMAIFCYTSGTTGNPKAAMLKQGAIVNAGKSWHAVDRWKPTEQYVSFLPPAWITEQGLGVAGSLIAGMQVSFPEHPETVQENIREIGAQILFWGPRNWESVNRLIQAKMSDTTWFNRLLYNLLLPVGYKCTDIRSAGKKESAFWKVMKSLANLIIFRDLKDKVGLSKIRVAYTAAGAISPDIIRYFQAIGVNIKQLYGGSEQGLVTMHRDDDIQPETSGQCMPGMNIKLTKEGEIIINGDNLFAGYYKNPEATAEKLVDGWYCSGDFGHITDDKHLIVMDRMSDVKELRTGQKFSPQYAEIRLRFSPYIKDALVIGGGDKDFVTCLVNIDIENVGRWAEARRIPYTTFTDLSQKPQVIELIRKDIENINKNLPEWARIRKFTNLHREFDADEAELTRTRKIKRTFVEEKYRELIDALYSGQSDLFVEATITYRDGRKGTIKTAVKINTLN
jgi:long-chain acyl-CoA synthetase